MYCWSSACRMSVLITAWWLMFNSCAARSSSCSISGVKSTFTLWIGFIILPVFVKNRDTSLPCSASRAMASAGKGFCGLRVLLIKSLLLSGGFPQSHEAVVLSFVVLSHLKNDGVQPLAHPPDGPILLRPIRAAIEVVGVRKNLFYLFESDASLRVRPQPLALALIELKSHEYNSYTTSD